MCTRSYGLIFGLAYLALLNINVEAGPAASRRLTREVYPEIESEADVNQSQVCIVGDLVYGINESVPSEQPCLKCKCHPPGVHCEALRCDNKKPGCKMVHRQDECCPDYQCECEYKGRVYSNGERLETSPGDECKVCYCKGGEIKCADVSCYVRNDCEGKQVPGQCCPKYDHCPTRDSLEKTPTNVTFSLISSSGVEVSEENSSTNKPTTNDYIPVSEENDNRIQPENGDENSLQNSKITIQEIIPEILEIPITSNPKEDFKMETQGKLIIEETKATEETGKENELFGADSEGESSELSEVIQSPPPVIRIGDNLLFLKKNELVNEKDAGSTPSSIITLIGAEGLQRGGFEEIENITNIDTSLSTSTNSDDKTNDLVTASSSHILSLVKKKKGTTPSQRPTTTTTTTPDNNLTTLPSPSQSSSSESLEALQSSEIPSQTSEKNQREDQPNNTDTSLILDVESNQNPAYPTQPDVLEEIWFKPEVIETENQTEIPRELKILPEILEVRNNKTIPSNMTNTEWLKGNPEEFVSLINLKAALPPEILSAPSDIDQEDETESEEDYSTTTAAVSDESTTTDASHMEINTLAENLTEIINSNSARSVESLEMFDGNSGEQTTPHNNEALTSNEDASVAENSKSSEVDDMLFVREYGTLSNDEEKSNPGEGRSLNDPNEQEKMADVELINVEELQKNNTQVIETPATPEKLATNRTITKRENTADDAIFSELDKELGIGVTDKLKTQEEEDLEARKIFEELLEETSTPKSKTPPGSKTKESESLEKVSQALAKLAFRSSQPLDVGVLSALRDFFSSQYKAYEKNAK